MANDFAFTIKRIRFDEHYQPADNTRITTNFANLARGERRQANLRNTLQMIDNRFNALAHWDNPNADRYAVELDIVSVAMQVAAPGVEGQGSALPLIEMLKTTVLDRHTGERIDGIVGNNFSSYVRDYDFSVRLSQRAGATETPTQFGELHGKLFKCFVGSADYQAHFGKPPVICLSVSSSKTYQRSENHHPVLGYEYVQNAHSLTDDYFAKMGLQVRYFMPANSVAPLAFYFAGDLLADYTALELISTISTMDTFQKIYRPEIYNANSAAGQRFQPSLQHEDYSLTRIVYDREERSRLALEQGRFAEEHFIKPYGALLEEWSAACAL